MKQTGKGRMVPNCPLFPICYYVSSELWAVGHSSVPWMETHTYVVMDNNGLIRVSVSYTSNNEKVCQDSDLERALEVLLEPESEDTSLTSPDEMVAAPLAPSPREFDALFRADY